MAAREVGTFNHGPISGPVNAGLGAVVVGLLGLVLHLDPWMASMPTILIAVATIYQGRRTRTALELVLFRAGCWVAAGGWTAWLLATGPSMWAAATLISVSAAAAILAPVFSAAPGPQSATAVLTVREAVRTALAEEWRKRILQIAKVEMTVANVAHWPHDTGFTLDLDPPPGSGYTWKMLSAFEQSLAAAAHLKLGCTVRAKVGENQGAILLDVMTVNGLAEEVPFPADYAPTSINNLKDIGVGKDRQPILIDQRQASSVTVGMRGSGKTTVLNTMIGKTAPDTDSRSVVIDLNGGGLAVPWMMAEAMGLVRRSPVMAVGYDVDSALNLAEIFLDVAKDRKTRGASKKAKANVTLLPMTPQEPSYQIFVDEGAEVLGDSIKSVRLKAALEELQRIGRDAGVNVHFSGLRGTGDVIPPGVRKQAAVRVVTKVEDDDEIAYVMGWAGGLSSADLLYPGNGYVRLGTERRAIQYMGYNLLPQQCIDISIATERYQPDLDVRALKIAGSRWAKALEYMRPWLAALVSDDDDEVPPPAVPEDHRTALARAQAAADKLTKRAGIAMLTTKSQEWYDQQFEQVAGNLDTPAPTDAADPSFSDLVQAGIDDYVERNGEPDDGEHPLLAAILEAANKASPKGFIAEFLRDRGPAGAKSKEIGEALAKAGIVVSRDTRQEKLRELVTEGVLLQPGVQGWYVHRDHHAAE